MSNPSPLLCPQPGTAPLRRRHLPSRASPSWDASRLPAPRRGSAPSPPPAWKGSAGGPPTGRPPHLLPRQRARDQVQRAEELEEDDHHGQRRRDTQRLGEEPRTMLRPGSHSPQSHETPTQKKRARLGPRLPFTSHLLPLTSSCLPSTVYGRPESTGTPPFQRPSKCGSYLSGSCW